MTKQSNTPEASARPKRVPIASRNRLEIKQREDGYSYRIVNDVDDRVSRFQDAGYEVCSNESVGAVGSRRVDGATPIGSAAHFSVGKGTQALVMRIPKEYAHADAKVKQEEIDAVESTMKGDARKAADYGSVDLK
jgi:hypothetical protein